MRYTSKPRRGALVVASLTLEQGVGNDYLAKVNFVGSERYIGTVDHTRKVGTQGSIDTLRDQLLEASEGICKLLDPHDTNPKRLSRNVKDCINSLYRQTKKLKFNTEPPF